MNTITSKGFYEISRQDEIAIIRIKKNVFEFITDIKLSGELLDFIDKINEDTTIKALLYYNDPDSFTEEEYDKFINQIMVNLESRENSDLPCFTEKNVRAKEINILNTFIRVLSKLHIIVVAGTQGTVVTPYIGTALAADFRYACEGTTFSMAHNKYGLHPSGGLPFFLSSFLHHSKALEIQSKDYITAEEALELGLINKILQKEKFVDQIILEIKRITRLNYYTIQQTKRLTNFSKKTLFDYFEYEAQILNL